MIHTYGQKIALVAGSLAMLAAIALAALTPAGTSAQAGSVVSMHPSKTNINVGDTVDIDISATGLNNLAGYEMMIQYNKSVLEFVSMTNGSFLGSTGRNVSCPEPVMLDDDATNEHKVLDGCATIGETPDGPSGDATLATFTFKAVADGTSDLLFRKIEFANPNGDDAAVVDSVNETAIAVGSGSNDNSGGSNNNNGGGTSSTPTPPPTPQPDLARLTPTAVSGAEHTDQAFVLSGENGTPAPSSSGSSTGSTSSSAGASSSGSAQGASSDPSSVDPNFPHAGYGPQHQERSYPSPFAIAALFVGGLVLAGLGVVSRVKRNS